MDPGRPGPGVSIRSTTSTTVTSEKMTIYIGERQSSTTQRPARTFKKNVPPFVYPLSYKVCEVTENDKRIDDILKITKEQLKYDLGSFTHGAFAVIMIHRCLNALGIESRVVYGFRSLGKTDKQPHVWLVIQKHTVDIVNIRSACDNSSKYLAENTPNCYTEEAYEYPDFKGTDCPHERRKWQEKKVLDFFKHNPDRGLALCLNEESLTGFFFSIIRHMGEKYKVTIRGVDPKVRYVCWNCGLYPKSGIDFLTDILSTETAATTENKTKKGIRFPHCHKCMVANYCSSACQKKDWVNIHRVICISRVSLNLCPPPLM